MIDNLNDTYAMKKLFLLVIVLFLSFQQLTLAAIKEMTSTPDSAYLFFYFRMQLPGMTDAVDFVLPGAWIRSIGSQ